MIIGNKKISKEDAITRKKQGIRSLNGLLESYINSGNEIDRMKTGSIAKVEQIISISKMRIIDPKQTGNVLHNISLSAASMKLINNRLQELYLFNNNE